MCFLFVVTRLWKRNSLSVIVYLLLAFFATVQSFECHISLNSESVYTSAVYNVKNVSCDDCVIENNARGVNRNLGTDGIKLQLSTFHFDPFLFLRPSNPME